MVLMVLSASPLLLGGCLCCEQIHTWMQIPFVTQQGFWYATEGNKCS